jgi:hypothetical protein
MIAIGFQFKSSVSVTNGHILRKGGGSGGDTQFFLIHDSSDLLWLRVRVDGSNKDVVRGQLTVGRRYDALGFWDGSNINTFLDGIVTGSDVVASGSINTTSTNGNLNVGNSPNSTVNANNANVLIEYLHIWNIIPAPPSFVARAFARDPFGPFRRDDEAENLVFVPAVVGAANPKGPLGHPLHGPFGGPI